MPKSKASAANERKTADAAKEATLIPFGGGKTLAVGQTQQCASDKPRAEAGEIFDADAPEVQAWRERQRRNSVSKAAGQDSLPEAGAEACSEPAGCADSVTAEEARWDVAIARLEAQDRERLVIARLAFDDDRSPVEIERDLSAEQAAHMIALLAPKLAELSPEGAEAITKIAQQVGMLAHQAPYLPATSVEADRARIRQEHREALDALRFRHENRQAELAYLFEEHLRSVAFSFGLLLEPVEIEASPADRALWEDLGTEVRRAQIEATRDLFEGDEDARSAAMKRLGEDECRLARAVFWRDGMVNGFRHPPLTEIRRELREAALFARKGFWEGTLSHIRPCTLQRWILRLSRGRGKAFGRGFERVPSSVRPPTPAEVAGFTRVALGSWAASNVAAEKAIGKARRTREHHWGTGNRPSSKSDAAPVATRAECTPGPCRTSQRRSNESDCDGSFANTGSPSSRQRSG